MALTAYQTLTAALLQAPSSPIPLVSASVLTSYINIARNQVAADGECVRAPATLTLTSGTEIYSFSLFASLVTATGSVIAVRSGIVGTQPLDIRSWEWFSAYYRTSTATGIPTIAAQQGQGVAGNLFFYPTPDRTINALFDVVCLPIPLVDDSTIEAIPALWTDAVPLYAAWWALMSLQRQNDAQMMMTRYTDLMRRARQLSTPTELPDNLPGGMGAQRAAAHGAVSQLPAAAPGQR